MNFVKFSTSFCNIWWSHIFSMWLQKLTNSVTDLPAGLLSRLQHTSVLDRGTGGYSISAASGSVSSSSRPTHSPTTRGRKTELYPKKFWNSNGQTQQRHLPGEGRQTGTGGGRRTATHFILAFFSFQTSKIYCSEVLKCRLISTSFPFYPQRQQQDIYIWLNTKGKYTSVFCYKI